MPGKVVAQLMDHANVDTTLNVCTQVLDGSLREAVDKVGSELFTIVHKQKKEIAVSPLTVDSQTAIGNDTGAASNAVPAPCPYL
ncbi:MAG TPA: hypothetical protein VH436_27750 [Vicinamibacterales bacterium]